MGGGRETSSCHVEFISAPESLLFYPILNTLPPHLSALTVLLCPWSKAGEWGTQPLPPTAAAGSVQLSNREIGERLQSAGVL